MKTCHESLPRLHLFWRCALALALSLAFGLHVQADILDTWTVRSSGTTNTLHAVAHGLDGFVAVGAGGTIVTSPEGEVWTSRESGVFTNLRAITFGQEQYVVMAANGAVLISSNGVNWFSHQTGTNFFPSAITYGRGLYVSAGGSLVLTSAEGTNWTTRWLPTPPQGAGLNLNDVAFANNRFVAVGWYIDTMYFVPRGVVFTSRDATNWMISAYGMGTATSVAASSNIIVVAVEPTSSIPQSSFVSADGTNWSLHPFTNGPVRDLTFAQGQFVAVGGLIGTSSHGTNWSMRAQDTNWVLNGAIFGRDAFVAVGNGGLILQSDRLPPLRFVTNDGSIGFHTNQFGFNITGPFGQAVIVDGSSNLMNWLPLQTNTLGSNAWFWTHADSTNFLQRFYRMRSL